MVMGFERASGQEEEEEEPKSERMADRRCWKTGGCLASMRNIQLSMAAVVSLLATRANRTWSRSSMGLCASLAKAARRVNFLGTSSPSFSGADSWWLGLGVSIAAR